MPFYSQIRKHFLDMAQDMLICRFSRLSFNSSSLLMSLVAASTCQSTIAQSRAARWSHSCSFATSQCGSSTRSKPRRWKPTQCSWNSMDSWPGPLCNAWPFRCASSTDSTRLLPWQRYGRRATRPAWSKDYVIISLLCFLKSDRSLLTRRVYILLLCLIIYLLHPIFVSYKYLNV